MFDQDYQIGDIVEIVTPKEYRDRGGMCTEECAIAQYAGSVCEVTDVYNHTSEVELSVIELVENFQKKYQNQNVSHYLWTFMAIKRHNDQTHVTQNDFDDVFA